MYRASRFSEVKPGGLEGRRKETGDSRSSKCDASAMIKIKEMIRILNAFLNQIREKITGEQ